MLPPKVKIACFNFHRVVAAKTVKHFAKLQCFDVLIFGRIRSVQLIGESFVQDVRMFRKGIALQLNLKKIDHIRTVDYYFFFGK